MFVAEGSNLREPLAVGSKNDAPTVRMDAETTTMAEVRPTNHIEGQKGCEVGISENLEVPKSYFVKMRNKLP